jgi:chromate reductase, NAD(P)H dehydrogenase (quinone)
MNKIKVLCLIGGISRDSLNKKLFKAVSELAPESIEILTYSIESLPYFSQDIENDPPDSVNEFKDKIRNSDALLLISPEYNRSFPGVLKNALDWGSRPYGSNLWDKMPAGLMGATPSTVGTFGAQHHLRQVLAYLNVAAMGQPEFYFHVQDSFDESGNLKDKKTKEIIVNYWEALTTWINKINQQDAFQPGKLEVKGQEKSSHPH